MFMVMTRGQRLKLLFALFFCIGQHSDMFKQHVRYAVSHAMLYFDVVLFIWFHYPCCNRTNHAVLHIYTAVVWEVCKVLGKIEKKTWTRGRRSSKASALKESKPCFQATGLLTAGLHKTPTTWAAKSFNYSLPYVAYFSTLIQTQQQSY